MCPCTARLAAVPVYAAHAAAVRAGSCGCGGPSMGDLLPKVVWPSDVVAAKRAIDPDMRATDASVTACTSLDAGTRSAWGQFFASWDAFYKQSEPLIFGAANQYDEAQSYKARLVDWQAKLSAACGLSAPTVPKPPEDAGSADVVAAIKFAAVAVVVAAGVYGVTRFV